MITPEHAAEVLASAQQLYSQAEVETALDRMAQQITASLAGHNPVLLCVLNGALIPMGYLLTRLAFPLRQDYIHATRYRGETHGADLHWIARPTTPLQGQRVLVVDDILDEGITLAEIVRYCQAAGARSVQTVVLVQKQHSKGDACKADFVGLQVPDRYVFGYGMDYKGFLRNTPGIYAVEETA